MKDLTINDINVKINEDAQRRLADDLDFVLELEGKTPMEVRAITARRLLNVFENKDEVCEQIRTKYGYLSDKALGDLFQSLPKD